KEAAMRDVGIAHGPAPLKPARRRVALAAIDIFAVQLPLVAIECIRWLLPVRRGLGLFFRLIARDRTLRAGALIARSGPAVGDCSEPRRLRRVRRAGLLLRQRLHGSLRIVEAGTHLEEHETRETVGLQLDLRPAAASLERVAGEMMADLMREDADSGPVRPGRLRDPLHEGLVVEDEAIPVAVDLRRRVGHVGRHDGEVLREARVIDDPLYSRLRLLVGCKAVNGVLDLFSVVAADLAEGKALLALSALSENHRQERGATRR